MRPLVRFPVIACAMLPPPPPPGVPAACRREGQGCRGGTGQGGVGERRAGGVSGAGACVRAVAEEFDGAADDGGHGGVRFIRNRNPCRVVVLVEQPAGPGRARPRVLLTGSGRLVGNRCLHAARLVVVEYPKWGLDLEEHVEEATRRIWRVDWRNEGRNIEGSAVVDVLLDLPC